MKDFIAKADRQRLAEQGLDSFDALWDLQLVAVDEPNTERGGVSSVYRLELPGQAYYLKRQSNHLTRSLSHPFGEPTFAREFRNIQRYADLQIPALTAAFFAQRQVPGEQRAILLTHALDSWQDLEHWLGRWAQLSDEQRGQILSACGRLARQLHQAGQVHGCFYPKHIFLQQVGEDFTACLIDLEKTRPLWLGKRDRIKDLEPLLRRAREWNQADIECFLATYLGDAAQVQAYAAPLLARRKHKESR